MHSWLLSVGVAGADDGRWVGTENMSMSPIMSFPLGVSSRFITTASIPLMNLSATAMISTLTLTRLSSSLLDDTAGCEIATA